MPCGGVAEALLEHHAATFSRIGQHAPVAQLDEATEQVLQNPDIDTVISIGGGSPIDSAKVLSFRVHAKTGSFLHHIAIPTTISAAECTSGAGYTRFDP
jgi:alcohol dehydrogenase class IV